LRQAEERLMLDSLPYAVIDFETTGYSPQRGDRVVEVAIVRLTPQGQMEREYSTLVNPGRDAGPVYVHDITNRDVADAPTFAEIAGDLVGFLRGAVLVAHNAKYDSEFLTAEFATAGYPLPGIPTLCTLLLSYMLHPEATRHRLPDCCARDGVVFEEVHNALSDARATAQLLLADFGAARKRHVLELRALACKPLVLSEAGWPDLVASGRVLPRLPVARSPSPDTPYLARLVAKLSGHGVMNPDVASYAHMLDHVLQDRRVTENEASVLMETAERYGLTRTQALEVHVSYLGQLIDAALADGVVSETEMRDLGAVAALLGLSASMLDAVLTERRNLQTCLPSD
jgi:DNA polymerase III epsilon subunit family exonuclease